MNRFPGYILAMAIIIGLVVSAGCIAAPGGMSTLKAEAGGSGSIGSVMDNQTHAAENQSAGQQEVLNETTGTEINPTYTEPVTPADTIPVTVVETPLIIEENKPGVLVPENPYPIETHPTEPPILDVEEAPPESVYREIYHDNVTFGYSAIAFTYNLGMPPLMIEYTVQPRMITDTKAYTSRFGKKEDEVVTTTYPSPGAWFEVIARDKTNGEIILRNGYGKDYTENLNQNVKLLKTGNYQIDFRGNDVTVDIRMLVNE